MNEEWLKEAERLADAYAKRRATVTQLLVVNSENGLAQFARVSEDVARSALMSHLARAAVPAVMPHDFITHKEAWREALRHCAERADTGEDAAYWQHELNAYDTAHAELAAAPQAPAVQLIPAAPLSDAQIEALLPKVRHRPGMIGYACYSFGEVVATVRAALGVPGTQNPIGYANADAIQAMQRGERWAAIVPVGDAALSSTPTRGDDGNTGVPASQPLRTTLDLTLTQGEAQNIAAFLDDDAESDAEVVRLLIGDGHSGYGLYAAHPDYPGEGAMLVKNLPAPDGVDLPDGGQR